MFVFHYFQAFGKACRIILKFAKHTHIDGYTTFLATGLVKQQFVPPVMWDTNKRETVPQLVKVRQRVWKSEAKEHCWYQPDIDFFASKLQDYFG